MSDKEVKQEQDALKIINDPKNRVTAEKVHAEQEEKMVAGLSRRDLLKYGSAAAAALSVGGAAATGFATARDGTAYTGYGRQFMGQDQFFNREPFRANVAAMMEPVGKVVRPEWHDYFLDVFFESVAIARKAKWNPSMGVETFPAGYIGDFYRSNPERYAVFVEELRLLAARQKYLNAGAYDRNALALAYHVSYQNFGATWKTSRNATPEGLSAALKRPVPPEEWDFRYINKNRKKLEFKSPAHASALIKTIAHRFGASFCAITDYDPTFTATNVMAGMPDNGQGWGDKTPEHWKSMIVLANPMEWDKMHASPTFFTAQDGYFRIAIVSLLLERFIQELGYPARSQAPQTQFEVMMTPYVLKSGLGEYARAGFAMIPEVGANFRSGGVITNIEFEHDKPININMAAFCKKCKICADTCPSGAIETGDEPKGELRGFKRWVLDQSKCHIGWLSTASGACGTCIAVCPFTRKNTWIHAISRELDARDVSGLVGEGLLAMQLNFFKYPTAEEFRGEFEGGKDAVYHNPPEWLKTENWFDNIDQYWEWEGMH